MVCAALMVSRTVITAIPLAGPLASDLLTMHKWSARLIVAAIDRKLARASAAPTVDGGLWPDLLPA